MEYQISVITKQNGRVVTDRIDNDVLPMETEAQRIRRVMSWQDDGDEYDTPNDVLELRAGDAIILVPVANIDTIGFVPWDPTRAAGNGDEPVSS